ncbi:MAG: hypothetical protein AB7E24_16815 [Novosphingobium sp.]
MSDAIFLSASVPSPERGPEYAKTADTVAIAAAVSALVHVTLGRRLLVWGGHPAITPMVWVVAECLRIDYGAWVKLYQTRYFEDEFPEDNKRFMNVTYTEDVGRDREKSLLLMRERMFGEQSFAAAVFIGGMGGVIEECELFQRLQPMAKVFPVASTGGAALVLSTRMPMLGADLTEDLDYVALFHRRLGISVKEQRYARPQDQPVAIDQRLWQPP